MAASSYTTKTPGSVISGVPFSLQYFDSYLGNFLENTFKVLEQAAETYEQSAKLELMNDPYWEDFSSEVEVLVNQRDSSIEFVGPFIMEYGDGQYPPSGILRKYALIAENELPVAIGKVTRNAA